MKKLLHITFTLVFTLISLLPLAQADEVTYFIPDASGSPVAAMNEAGDILWRKHYQPLGGELDAQVGTHRIGYTGHVKDQTTGLNYMGARYYDPSIGLFMSMDPAAINPNDPRTFNRYNYANNNSYRFVDPDGKIPVPLIVWGVMAGLTAIDMMYNPPVPGHEQDGIASVITLPGPIKLGGKVATEAVEQGSEIVAKRTGIVAKDGTEITGFTKHGVNRAIGDGAKRAGTKPDAILDALKNPTKIKEGVDSQERPFKIYTGENARVVINPETGKVVSTNPLSRDGAHLP